MAVVQDTYNNAPAAGFAGMVANGETSNRISRTIEDAAGIAFGKAAFRGAGDHGVTGTPGAGFLGIVIADHGLPLLPGGTADTFPQYASVPLITEGVVMVSASLAVADGDPVYVTPGKAFTNVSNSGANTALTGWVYDGTLGAAGLVNIARR